MAMRMRPGPWLAALAVALPISAALAGAVELKPPPGAEDGPRIVEYLRGQPATLLDLSLVRLDARLAAVGAAHRFWAHASAQDGVIRVYAYDDRRPISPASCKEVLDAIRFDAGVDLETGGPIEPASGYASLFSYPRIREIEVSDTYMETVDAMLMVKVVLGTTGDGQGLVCDAALLAKDFTHSAQ
ncbi:hypothetical protein [Zavarzinia sp. CC-PAN008]|uniref:hypothetical protein n=1 Tax=Zavarzinia sp. CC-PAN008 TaxID=3243332 RepID=UPI003F747FDE